jgi:hypothetical protein
MAIVGARPAQPWFLGGRSARRPRTRPAPERPSHRARARRVRESRRDVRPLLLAIVIAAGLALVYLSQSTRVAATGYEIDALQATLAEQRAVHQQLVSAIGHARSPAEITNRAQQELGLVPLDEASVQFVPGSAAPSPGSRIDD